MANKQQATVAPMYDEATGATHHFKTHAVNNKMVTFVQFKLEGVTYDEVTGLFSMQMEQKMLDEQDWSSIAGAFGLNSVPEHLRDDLCSVVRKQAIMEQLAERYSN